MASVAPSLRFPKFQNDWVENDLGSLATTVTSGSRDWAQYYSDEGSKFVRMTNLPRGGIQLLLDDLRYVELPENSSEGKRTSLEAHDILISITAELGKIGLIPSGFGTAYINQHTALVRLDQSRSDARFVAHMLSSERMNNMINSLNDAGAKAGLNLPTIKSFDLHTPTLPEQRKIADFLTAVDGRIGQLSQKKALLEDYKKGVMQQLFTQALRFKDDHGNDFPEWEEKTLGAITKCFSGGTPSSGKRDYYGGSIPFIRSAEIAADSTALFLTEKGLKESAAKMVEAGDLLVALYGANSGEVGISKVTGAINQAILCVRTKQSVRFLYFWLEFSKQSIVNTYLQGGQGNLSGKIVQSLNIEMPTLPEQTKIANFLTALDRKIESVAQQITHTQTFKKGLLQQMFV